MPKRVLTGKQPQRGGSVRRDSLGGVRSLGGWEFTMEGPVDNLVKAFAIHLEACSAKGDTQSTLTQYEGRYRQYLTFLRSEGYNPPFGLDLLNAQLVRRCAVWIRERSTGHRGGQSAVKALTATLKTGSAWLADEGYLHDYVDPLARVKRPKAPSVARTP